MAIAFGYCSFIPISANTLPMTHRKHIALLIPDLCIGGAERVFVNLSRQFIKRQHKVTIIVCKKAGALIDELPKEVMVVSLDSISEKRPSWIVAALSIFRLRRTLHQLDPDVLLSTLTGTNLVALITKILFHPTLRLVIREAAPLTNTKSRLKTFLRKQLYRFSDEIIVLNQYMLEEFARLPLPKDRVHIIGNPINSKHISNLALDFKPPENLLPYIVSVGRLAKQKDFSTLIIAFSKLPISNLKLIIIGEGPERNSLNKLINELGLNARVFLFGETPNPYPWMKNAALYVSSSIWEGYPNALCEAAIIGARIVATEYDPSIYSLLSCLPQDRYTILPSSDPTALAEVIKLQLQVDARISNADGASGISDTVIDSYESLLFNN